MRYHINGFFKEEQRKGFVVTHSIDRYTDDALLVADILNGFTSAYDKKYCYGLSIGICEEADIID